MRFLTAEECPQLSPQWWEARRGLVTASSMDKIMSPAKRKASASQEKYIASLIADITCLSPNYFTQQGGPVNAAVEYGRQTEEQARAWYEMKQGVTTTLVGGCLSDCGRWWASPDALVGEEGGLELKCCNRDTHALYLLKDEVPRKHLMQVHGCLIVTGRKWWDFCSYATGLPGMIKRVFPNDLTMALRVQLELFSTKFEAAKKRFNVNGEAKKEAELTQDQLLIFKEYVDRLALQPTMEHVNSWLPELPSMEYELKRKVWQLLQAHAKQQVPEWHFDRAKLEFGLQEPT